MSSIKETAGGTGRTSAWQWKRMAEAVARVMRPAAEES
jgi:hypothetical protein